MYRYMSTITLIIQLVLVCSAPLVTDLSLLNGDFPRGVCGPLRQHAVLDALSCVFRRGSGLKMGFPKMVPLNGCFLRENPNHRKTIGKP